MKNEIILFENQEVRLEVNVADETVWLSLDQMSELFERDKSVISRHIKNIMKEELDNSVVANFATTASDGKIYQVDYYNLDMIISVGYRVKSKKGIIFRKWICPNCHALHDRDINSAINILQEGLRIAS